MQLDWPSLLVQIPIVVAFIWFSLKMNEQAQTSQQAFMAALDKRDTEFEKRNYAVITALNELTRAINCHDDNVQARISAIQQAAIRERPTRPRKDAN